MSFQRTQTTVPLANHIIQWNYDFYGQGVRDLNIGANLGATQPTQKPRTPSLMSLNGEINELVYAICVSFRTMRTRTSYSPVEISVSASLVRRTSSP